MWEGQFKDKSKKPTIVLEAVSDGDLYIWHSSLGYPGSVNDVSIFSCSETIGMPGESPLHITFVINGVTRPLAYWLADGIYPLWAIFANTITGSSLTDKQALYARMQEAFRKDLECAFGVSFSQFRVLKMPFRLCRKDNCMDFLRACTLLHNICVEARRDRYASQIFVRAMSDTTATQFGATSQQPCNWQSRDDLPANFPAGTWAVMVNSRHMESVDDIEHREPKVD